MRLLIEAAYIRGRLLFEEIRYFCDTRNNIESGRRSLFFFQPSLFVNRVPTGKDSDILFGREYKRERFKFRCRRQISCDEASEC